MQQLPVQNVSLIRIDSICLHLHPRDTSKPHCTNKNLEISW